MNQLSTTRLKPKLLISQLSTLPTRSLASFPLLGSRRPVLTYLKVHHPNKAYRLCWQFLGQLVYCEEDQKGYKKVHGKGGVTEVGERLAGLLGVVWKS